MKIKFAAVVLSMIASVSCQEPNQLTNAYLNGTWEYLGSWENAVLQQDTLAVYFLGSSDTTLRDSRGYLVVTDSGTWRFTKVDNETTAAQRDPYYMTFDFENDSVGYFRDQDSSHFLINSYDLNWSGDQLAVYAKPVIDEMMAETIVPTQQGMVERVSEDTLQIRWDHGIVNKFKRVGPSKGQ